MHAHLGLLIVLMAKEDRAIMHIVKGQRAATCKGMKIK
jgi:hypothetical protein